MFNILEKILKERKLTVYKLSKETGIAQATFSIWKNKNLLPSIKNLKIISNYLNVDINIFLGLKPVKNIELTKEEENLINNLREKKIDKDLLEFFSLSSEIEKEKYLEILKIIKTI